MTRIELVIGTRGSQLAMAQAGLVVTALESQGQPCRLSIIETEGDRRTPDTAWGEGAFVAAIELALLDGRVDIAVHSAKDVPTDEDDRLHIVAYLPRADPRDALVVRSDSAARRLADLPAGTRVGTDSPRRTGFLRALRPDLVVHPLHGNVDTRLRRLESGETDAVILAAAGLDRLARGGVIAERIDVERMPPAPGQGALAVQLRRGDARAAEIVSRLDDQVTRRTVEAERAFLAASGGGCRAPIGALAVEAGGQLDIIGGVASLDGRRIQIARLQGDPRDAIELGRALWARLPRPRVLVTRAAEQGSGLMDALREQGLEPIHVPTIAIETQPAGEIAAALLSVGRIDTVIVTSLNGARAIVGVAGAELRSARWVAIGPGTRRALQSGRIEVTFEPASASGDGLAAALPVADGERILLVRGDLADTRLPDALRARGAVVIDAVVYRTIEGPESSRALLKAARAGRGFDAVTFTSGSTARGLAKLDPSSVVIPVVTIGRETSEQARRAGFRVMAEASRPDVATLAGATADALANESQESR